MKLILMGAPGSGKGTQAEVISERFEIPAISTGAILREEAHRGTELGLRAKTLIDEGNFVPDEMMGKIIETRLRQSDCANGFILDGYPRNLQQVKCLDAMGVEIDRVLYVHLDDEVIIERISGRRVCDNCGETYHLSFQPSAGGELCEKCGGKLVVRNDDRPETIRERLETYHEVTYPVVELYRQRGLLLEVESSGSIEATTEQTLRVLEDSR